MGLGGFLNVDNDAKGALAIGNRHADESLGLHAVGLLVGDNLLDDGISHLAQAVHLAVKRLDDSIIQDFLFLAVVHAAVFLFLERSLDGVGLEYLHLEVLEVIGAVPVNDVLHTVIEGIDQVQTDALTDKGVVAAGVDHLTLGIHHIIILEQMLTDTEVVFLDSLLGVLDALGHHVALDSLTVLKSQTVERLDHALAGEQTHQLILERYKEYRRTRVSLTTGTTTQLAVHTA